MTPTAETGSGMDAELYEAYFLSHLQRQDGWFKQPEHVRLDTAATTDGWQAYSTPPNLTSEDASIVCCVTASDSVYLLLCKSYC